MKAMKILEDCLIPRHGQADEHAAKGEVVNVDEDTAQKLTLSGRAIPVDELARLAEEEKKRAEEAAAEAKAKVESAEAEAQAKVAVAEARQKEAEEAAKKAGAEATKAADKSAHKDSAHNKAAKT
jgi:colicin import membrane protein